MTGTSEDIKQALALADACAGDWDAVRPHLVVQALRDLVARVRELEAEKARLIESYISCPSATEVYMYGITQENQK